MYDRGQNRLLWRNLPATGGLSGRGVAASEKWRSVVSSDARPPVGYKTHMLIGVRPNGIMTVLADWPYVPRQAEVQEQIDVTPESYDAFVLATPTSIMPGNYRPSSGANWKSRSSGHW
jgi:hypothetical protein